MLVPLDATIDGLEREQYRELMRCTRQPLLRCATHATVRCVTFRRAEGVHSLTFDSSSSFARVTVVELDDRKDGRRCGFFFGEVRRSEGVDLAIPETSEIASILAAPELRSAPGMSVPDPKGPRTVFIHPELLWFEEYTSDGLYRLRLAQRPDDPARAANSVLFETCAKLDAMIQARPMSPAGNGSH